MTQKSPLQLDPKDLTAAIIGVGLAIALMVFFYFMSLSMGQDTFVRHALIPHQ